VHGNVQGLDRSHRLARAKQDGIRQSGTLCGCEHLGKASDESQRALLFGQAVLGVWIDVAANLVWDHLEVDGLRYKTRPFTRNAPIPVQPSPDVLRLTAHGWGLALANLVEPLRERGLTIGQLDCAT
jgi:hypothetical protein